MTDMLDLARVTILNSPDVRGWPITSTITHLALHDGRITIDHTKRGQWPAVPYENAEQEATIWVFFKIGGQWCGTGGERLRPNQTEKELGKPSDIGPGWLYAADRWQQMAGYVPTPGEIVGFLIAAGISRNLGGAAPLQERTAVVLIPFPTDAVGGVYPPFAELAAPYLPPAPAPPPASVEARLAAIEATLEALLARPMPAFHGTITPGGYTVDLKPVTP
jgi:hypothetical protein